jgi:hypothetical protein
VVTPAGIDELMDFEWVNTCIRRAVKAHGRFPDEQATLTCIYMAIMWLDSTGKGQARWTMCWKTVLNAFHHLRRPLLNSRSVTPTTPMYGSIGGEASSCVSGPTRRCQGCCRRRGPARQEIIFSVPMTISFVIEEAVLRRPWAGTTVYEDSRSRCC